MFVTICIIVFANLFGMGFMWLCGSDNNISSRTERELQILEKENNK